ncbi:hypothetical protein K2173_017380 [Erythroxylum novogranatense]|uniref:WAT1-related protein n=1 Tax=Erythroxylum novogranatense TaxID=1862640 RepID=A0AAV8TKB8_9ROSI|nr:hypothetical protein K2173_017380 [Erythroxylum novogranatense]
MSGLGGHKPTMAMFGVEFCYAAVALISRAAFLQGTSPRVFVVYRQVVATLAIAPIAYFSRRKSGGPSLGLRSFTLIFLASLIGITINQIIYFEGLYLASSSIGSAMGNLVPAITFALASILGLEKISIRSFGSLAKIVGTILCVSGAVSMALLRGPKLLNAFIFGSEKEKWLMGCLLLFGSACCWSLWLILQVHMTACYPDHLSLSAWMCFFGAIQSAIVTLFLERDLNAWIVHSDLEILSYLFSGAIGSGLAFYVQAWCISQRGPLFSAMFNPACTVIVTILAAPILHEEIYIGSLIGAVGVVIGLYFVLWGKAKDILDTQNETEPKFNLKQTRNDDIFADESKDGRSCKHDLEQPLLAGESNGAEKNVMNQ